MQLPVEGTIILAFHKSRSTGGSEVVGEVELDLEEIARYGAVDFHKQGYEARSFQGAKLLHSRGGEDVGECNLILSIAWIGDAARATRSSVSDSQMLNLGEASIGGRGSRSELSESSRNVGAPPGWSSF